VTDLKALMDLSKKASAAPWTNALLVGKDGITLQGDEAKKYAAEWIDSGGPEFFAVLCEKPDGRADVCHTGNGPTSEANAAYIAAACNSVPSLIQRLQAAEEERDRYKAAMELMLSPETDWDDGAVGVGYGFRNIARLALTTPTKSEEKR
jgi:hypothetical protein